MAWHALAQAAQRLVNAATAANAVQIHSPQEDAVFDELDLAEEAVIAEILSGETENKKLISSVLDQCAEAIRTWR